MTADPLIILVAPNGARKQKSDHAALPLTADELAATARACRDAGAAMIHLHIRDAKGRHSIDAETYRDAVRAVRNAAGEDFIVQVTSEAAGVFTPPEQRAMVMALQPEAVSLAIREFFPKDDPAECNASATFMADIGSRPIWPQFILYDLEDIHRFHALRDEGVISHTNPFILLVLGRYSASGQSEPSDLLPLHAALRDDEVWSVCAFGAKEAACALTAAALGGHCRVGFENNALLADGQVAADNTALVAQVAQSAAIMGRSVAEPNHARRLLAMDGS